LLKNGFFSLFLSFSLRRSLAMKLKKELNVQKIAHFRLNTKSLNHRFMFIAKFKFSGDIFF